MQTKSSEANRAAQPAAPSIELLGARELKLPRGRHAADGLSREQVAAHQRLRLYGAMIELAATRGYVGTTTRELSRLAGVSKQDMYRRFPSKEAYFLATYDFIVRRAVRRIAVVYGGEGHWRERLRGAFGEFAALAALEPKAARLVLVEVLDAGPAALARLARTRRVFEQLVGASFGEAPDGLRLPPQVVRGIVCGVERVTRQALLAGSVERLPGLADQLLEWAL
jgi:AcrR family transcriptional regulator